MTIVELTERLEILSARYGERYGFERTGDWFLLKLQEEVGELTQAHLQHTGRARSKGRSPDEIRETLEEEFADALCQLLLFARHHAVDLPAAIDRKWFTHEQPASGAGRT